MTQAFRTSPLLMLFGLVLCAGWWTPGRAAAPAAAPGFNAAAAASVWGAALTYIAPRALIETGIPQMTVWGLNGLTALDPDITVAVQGGVLTLYGPQAVLLTLPAPAAGDVAGWARAAAAVAAAGYAASPALQAAGTQGLIASFFDELFNHFDAYSRYEPAAQAAQDQLMIAGLAGAGFTIRRAGAQVVVDTVAADGPAAGAGITAGDVLLALNGRTALAGDVVALSAALQGLPGTTVALRVQDPAEAVPEEIRLVRAYVPAQTVFPMTLGGGAIGLKISSFNKGTSDNFSAALAAALGADQSAGGLVIDLRGNRGGVLPQAVLVADTLLQAGQIVRAEGRDPDADQSFSAQGADITDGLKLVVLVDGETASAAEILAAALADNRRAVVVGSETLGKGLVQTLTALPDGGELYVTWSRVLAPRGWPLQGMGVMPQVCTSLGAASVQTQLRALADGRNLLAPVLAAARRARAPVPPEAVLTIRDACPAAIGGALDVQAAASLLAAPAAYQAALLP